MRFVARWYVVLLSLVCSGLHPVSLRQRKVFEAFELKVEEGEGLKV